MSEHEEQDNEWMNAPMGEYSKVDQVAELTRQLEEAKWNLNNWGVIEFMVRNVNVDSFVKEKEKELSELKLALEEARKERDEYQRAFRLLKSNGRENSELKLALAKMRDVLEKYFESERVESLGYFGIQRKYSIEEREFLLQEALSSPSPSLSSIVELVKAVELSFLSSTTKPKSEGGWAYTEDKVKDALARVKQEYSI